MADAEVSTTYRILEMPLLRWISNSVSLAVVESLRLHDAIFDLVGCQKVTVRFSGLAPDGLGRQ
jgi:hypothetical protein